MVLMVPARFRHLPGTNAARRIQQAVVRLLRIMHIGLGQGLMYLEGYGQGSWFRVQGSEFKVQGSGFRVRGSGFMVQGSGSRVQGSGSGG